MESERAKYLALLARRAVPALFEESSVAVVMTNGAAHSPLGAGTLFRIADLYLVVTAAESIAKASRMGCGLAISGAEGRVIGLSGKWIGSSGAVGDGDIALYTLAGKHVALLHGKEFAGPKDLSVAAEHDDGYFQLLGYPVLYPESAGGDAKKTRLGIVRRGATRITTQVVPPGFDPNAHILLDAADQGQRDEQEGLSRLRPAGHDVTLPLDGEIDGFGGCGVWRIGRPGLSPMRWRPEHAILVGVRTGSCSNPRALKITRWSVVCSLIEHTFPDAREALGLVTRS